jgi:hypothetical protein
MKIRLTESELISLIRQTIKEQPIWGDPMRQVTRGQRNCSNASLERKDRKLARQQEKEEKKNLRIAKRTGKDVQSFQGKWAELSNKEMDENKIDDIIDKYKSYLSEICLSDADTIVKAAITDSDSFNTLMGRTDNNGKYIYDRYFENGKLKLEVDPRNIGSNELIFFKNYFPDKKQISPEDILNLFISKLGGLKNYETTINSYYKLSK